MKIRGNTVGTTMPRADYAQTDPTKADYIKNKPDLSGIELAQETANYASAVAEGAQSGVDEVTTSLENAHRQLSNALDHKLDKSGDTMSGALTVVEPTEAGHAVPKSYVDKKHAAFTSTLYSSSWISDSVGYHQSVTISGLLATDEPILDINGSGMTYADMSTIEAEWTPYKAETGVDLLTVWFYSKPSHDIPIKLKVVR